MFARLNQLLAAKGKTGPDMEVDRDCSLRVFLNDALCLLVAWDRGGAEVLRQERALPENRTDSRDLLATVIETMAPDLERRIGKVEIFLDDASLSVLDSRQAKLSHFEGRALAEFGKYQLGGKPVCFASHRFGETSAQETEKRAVAYISEDRLTAILFALGKLARYATFFGPWSLQGLFAANAQESWAHLSFHRAFSTLTLANGSAGALAVRQLPFGSQDLVQSYACMHGVSETDARAALAARCRLGPPAPAVNDPVTHTGSFQALNPVMVGLAGEIAATSDYFEFQRLAGRAPSLVLSSCGNAIAGFGNWLGEMLQVDIDQPKETISQSAAATPALNLLEGMRSGLLKLGNQHFDFVGGHFVPAKTASGEAAASQRPSSLAKWKSLSSQPVSAATLKPLAKPALAAVLMLGVLYAGYDVLLSPAGINGDTAANLYNASLAQLEKAEAPPQMRVEPVLWAKDLLSISAAMPYDIKLKRIAVTAGAGTVASTLEITGILPHEGQDNLQLVSRFITRLTGTASLRRRFSDVSFAGLGAGDAKDSSETSFKVIAKVAGAAP